MEPHPYDGSRQRRAAEVLEVLLEDGEWHRSEDLMPTVKKLAKCEAKTVTHACKRAGVEVRWTHRPHRSGRATDWRIPRELGGGHEVA